MKRKILILSVLAILLAILAANTLAYFTADTAAHNVITTGNVDIALNEWANEERTERFEKQINVLPGTPARRSRRSSRWKTSAPAPCGCAYG